MIKKIYLARHQGFCMGVKRAIKIAEETADRLAGKENVTILNEIVHNEAVVEKFRQKGVGQVLNVDQVDRGTLIISAHGISPEIVHRAEAKGLTVVDATCPLVTRIYEIIEKAIGQGYYIIHFGEAHHDETAGVVGHAPDRITVVGNKEEMLALPDWKDRKLGLTVQTTAHVDLFNEIKAVALEKWPHIKVFNTVCNATTQRQSAIMELAPKVDIILVVGSRSSANSNRLTAISEAACGRGRLINSKDDIDPNWFEAADVNNVGVSAGASTPQFLVDAVIERLVEISNGRAEVIIPVRNKPAETNSSARR
ncbi:MAG TPA: 4-hydroxy-3-methylbut-2-enyl diphosphate reductase [candidate division Zixibacteria bacterium]|nr:4-hydroxy-3-methylbut-2-enyl diphosphate reductase [candidate division Zixibacteria bacterium]